MALEGNRKNEKAKQKIRSEEMLQVQKCIMHYSIIIRAFSRRQFDKATADAWRNVSARIGRCLCFNSPYSFADSFLLVHCTSAISVDSGVGWCRLAFNRMTQTHFTRQATRRSGQQNDNSFSAKILALIVLAMKMQFQK